MRQYCKHHKQLVQIWSLYSAFRCAKYWK